MLVKGREVIDHFQAPPVDILVVGGSGRIERDLQKRIAVIPIDWKTLCVQPSHRTGRGRGGIAAGDCPVVAVKGSVARLQIKISAVEGKRSSGHPDSA